MYSSRQHLARLVSPVVEHLESQPQQKAEYLLMVTVYVLFIALLSLALYYRGTSVSTAIIAIVLVFIVIEAVYVLYYKFGTSMCDICREVACDSFEKTKA